jgi:hypothetical protein
MTEISTTKINANGSYSNYFQLGENGFKIYQGTSNPNNASLNPLPQNGDMYLCTSLSIVYIYDNTWSPIGQSSSNSNLFFYQNITQNNFQIGNDISFDGGILYCAININSDCNLYMPASSSPGTIIILKDELGISGTYPITINSQNGILIDNQSAINIDINYGSYTFLFYNNSWNIISAISSYPLNQLKLGGNFSAAYTPQGASTELSTINSFEYNSPLISTISTNQIISIITIKDYVYIPINFTGSIAHCITAPSNNVTINITQNGTFVGSLCFYSSTFGVFSSNNIINLIPGDNLTFTVSLSDSTISNIFFTLCGYTTPITNTIEPYIKIVNTLEPIIAETPFVFEGNVYPNNKNINFGYSMSNTIPPENPVLITPNSNGFWNGTLTFPNVLGTYFVWAEMYGTNNYTILEVIPNVILPSFVSINPPIAGLGSYGYASESVFTLNGTTTEQFEAGISNNNLPSGVVTWYDVTVQPFIIPPNNFSVGENICTVVRYKNHPTNYGVSANVVVTTTIPDDTYQSPVGTSLLQFTQNQIPLYLTQLCGTSQYAYSNAYGGNFSTPQYITGLSTETFTSNTVITNSNGNDGTYVVNFSAQNFNVNYSVQEGNYIQYTFTGIQNGPPPTNSYNYGELSNTTFTDTFGNISILGEITFIEEAGLPTLVSIDSPTPAINYAKLINVVTTSSGTGTTNQPLEIGLSNNGLPSGVSNWMTVSDTVTYGNNVKLGYYIPTTGFSNGQNISAIVRYSNYPNNYIVSSSIETTNVTTTPNTRGPIGVPLWGFSSVPSNITAYILDQNSSSSVFSVYGTTQYCASNSNFNGNTTTTYAYLDNAAELSPYTFCVFYNNVPTNFSAYASCVTNNLTALNGQTYDSSGTSGTLNNFITYVDTFDFVYNNNSLVYIINGGIGNYAENPCQISTTITDSLGNTFVLDPISFI